MSNIALHPNGLHQHSMFYENKVLEIINSLWSHLNITNLSYRRFHREKGIFYIGNAFELQNVFWEHFNSASLSYLLRGCDGRKLWAYSKDSTENDLELEMFQTRKSEYKLPSGLVKVFYYPEYFEIFHFASTEINLQKNNFLTSKYKN